MFGYEMVLVRILEDKGSTYSYVAFDLIIGAILWIEAFKGYHPSSFSFLISSHLFPSYISFPLPIYRYLHTDIFPPLS